MVETTDVGTIGVALRVAKSHGVDPLDAEVLLAHLIGKNRDWLLAHPEHQVPAQTLSRFFNQVERRIAGQPLAYLTGTREFYGRPFEVTPNVLVPRPESELLVELALLRLAPGDTLVDIGTGSGALAVSIALERPDVTVIASDISRAALQVARGNARDLGADISFQSADLCPPLAVPGPQCVIVANLPYVNDRDYQSNPDLAAEPALALRGGPDGLQPIRRLFKQLQALNFHPKSLLLEIDPRQHIAILQLTDTPVRFHRDLAGRNRVAEIHH